MPRRVEGEQHKPRVRIGVVGLGYWGPNIARNVADLPQAELAYLCDSRAEVLETLGRRYQSASLATRLDELLADPSLDALAFATPVSTHAELAARALEAGKHVFVEKPLAVTSSEAERLIELAERQRRVLMPGHTFLYSPPVLKIKELIDAGELGEIYFISTSRVNLGLHQQDVSVVWDLGPHDFSILRFWLDALPERVSAASRSCVLPGVPDVAFVNLSFASGAIAHVELSWLAPSKLRRTAIVGSRKMIVYDDTNNESVRIFDSGADLPDPEDFGEYRLSYRTGDIVSPRIDPTEPLSLELADFCAAVLEGRALRSSPQIGLDVIRTIEAVDRSLAADGASMVVDAVGERPAVVDELAARIPTRRAGRAADRRLGKEPKSRAELDLHSGEPLGVAVLGGGPAGLTAAYVMGLRGAPGVVFEADGTVGGIAKTVEFDGYRFDLGGHRFFTKLKQIERLWEEVLDDDFLIRPRLSRIYYDGKYFAYPLAARDVVGRLGMVESMRCALSYLWALRRRGQTAETFEDWVTIRFGKRLYEAFFRSYTEKVWGIPGSEIRSQWAAQRIKNFSLGKAILSLLGLRREHVTTLIEEFKYPRLGPGQMWEAFRNRVETAGIPVRLNHRAVEIRHADGRVDSILVRTNGHLTEHDVEGVLSTIPLSELVLSLEPAAPPDVVAAARRLRYRDFCLVALMTEEEKPFPDNWIYLHDPGTRAGRVQNYGAWSDGMVKPGTTCLGVEYFCFEGDEIWDMPSEDAVELATTELARIGLIDPDKVIDGVKVRVPKAYPMYDSNYEEAVEVVRQYVEGFENLKTFGRNGLHRYNNQDHSMWTAILGTLSLLDGSDYDVWSVNVEAEYLEDGEIVDELLGVELVPEL